MACIQCGACLPVALWYSDIPITQPLFLFRTSKNRTPSSGFVAYILLLSPLEYLATLFEVSQILQNLRRQGGALVRNVHPVLAYGVLGSLWQSVFLQ